MTATIGRLFGWSPFRLLQQHMAQVTRCVETMRESLDAFERGSWEDIEAFAEEVSKQEHQADKIKDEIRHNLSRRLFMPVDRGRVLEILGIQDTLADKAQDVCVVLTVKRLKILPAVADSFREFRELNVSAVDLVARIVNQLDELVESGFGGAEAEKVRTMVHDVALTEHKADVIQQAFLKELFTREAEFTQGELYLWMQLMHELASLSNQSENLANRIMSTLELK